MMPRSGEQARREQILAVDLDIGIYTFSSVDCVIIGNTPVGGPGATLPPES